jgi:hypothetical protein
MSASTAATYIFTAPTCTTTIVTLEPCALNAEFQHFILRFNKKFLLSFTTERGDSGEREGDFTHNFNVWKMSQNCCGEFCPKHGSFYIKLKKTTVLAFI